MRCLSSARAVGRDCFMMLCRLNWILASRSCCNPRKVKCLSVCAFGPGPVGILTAQCALYRGAARVIVIDEHAYRLVRSPLLPHPSRASIISYSHRLVRHPLPLNPSRAPVIIMTCVPTGWCTAPAAQQPFRLSCSWVLSGP